MRLKKYIIETVDIGNRVSFEELLDILWRKCNPFLKDLLRPGWNGEFLYSGRNKTQDVFIGKVRSNRKPSDTNEKIHEILDEIFYDQFGFNARSNVIFCTGSYSEAADYGNVYIIFPMNKYKFVYSDTIRDLYNIVRTDGAGRDNIQSFDDFRESRLEDYTEEARSVLERSYEDQYSEDLDGHWEYHDFDVDVELPYGVDKEEAIDHIKNIIDGEDGEYNREFLEWVPDMELDEFVEDNLSDELDSYEDQIQYEYEEYLKNSLEDIILSEYKNDNIINAIESDNEIMVNCKTYIAVDYNKYYKALKSYYKMNGYKEPKITHIKNWYKKNKGRVPKQLILFDPRKYKGKIKSINVDYNKSIKSIFE